MREIRQVDLVALVAPGPAEDREVGDRQLIGDEVVRRQPPVEHAVQPAGLVGEALQPVGALRLVLQRDEMMHLAGHRAEAAHLPHQPFIHRDPLQQRLGQEFAGLLAEIEQDRAGFEYADRHAVRALGVDDRRNLVVRADRQEVRLLLLALGDVDGHDAVRQPHFLERDRDLAAIRRIPRMQFDGHAGSPGVFTSVASPAGPAKLTCIYCRSCFGAGMSAPWGLDCREFMERDCLDQISRPRPPVRHHP